MSDTPLTSPAPKCDCYADYNEEVEFCALHAAAPEMLEALKLWGNSTCGEDDKAAGEASKAAIAKAEGK